MKADILKGFFWGVLSLVAGGLTLSAQTYNIGWYKIGGGGGTSAGADYTVSGTVGQLDASGPLIGGNYSLTGGFWVVLGAPSGTTNCNGATLYYGNSLAVPYLQAGESFVADQVPPLVILGEYNPSGPLAGSGLELPSGTVRDVKWYGTNADFTMYALAYVGPGTNANEQVFRVESSETFSNSIQYPPGTNVLSATNFYVNCGDLLAFAGIGPFYPNFESENEPGYDATYGNETNNTMYPLAFQATPPVQNETFTVGVAEDTDATYDYIPDIFNNQGRYYAIGVDIAECGACTSNCISINYPGNIVTNTCGGPVALSYVIEASDVCTNVFTLTSQSSAGTASVMGTTGWATVTGGGLFGLGTTIVSNTVADSAGNVESFAFTVTVQPGNCCPNILFTNFATNVVSSAFLQLNGSAALTNDVEGYPVLRLTPASSFQAGSAFVPVQFGANLSFSTEFAFQMTNGDGSLGDGTTNPSGADGICFVLANAPTDAGLLGGAGGQVGYAGISSSVAIKFDTWDDSTALGFLQQNDPSGNFVAVYKNGSVNTAGYVPYLPANSSTTPEYYLPATSMKNGDIWYAWVVYNGANSELDVYLSDGSPVRPAAPQLIQSISLNNASILGEEPQLYAGFTSGTGGAWDNNDILFWQLSSPCTNACLTVLCSNLVAHTCGSCTNVPFMDASFTNPCCSNTILHYSYPSNYCFPVNTTNTVQVVAADSCGNVVSNYFTVSVLPCQETATNCLRLTEVTSNLTVYTCGTCAPIMFANGMAYGAGWASNVLAYSDACCSNAFVTYFPSNYCFPVDSTTPVQVAVYDACGNAVSTQLTVTVLPGNCASNNCLTFFSGMTGPNSDIPLAAGAPDPNFILVSEPAGAGNTAVVSSPPGPNWLPDTSSSQWISPNEDSANEPGGVYHYQLNFDVGCTNSQLVGRMAADDGAVLFLNGQPVGAVDGWTSWTSIDVSSGFVPGDNMLDIYVTNLPDTYSGIRAELSVCPTCANNCTNSCIRFSNVTNVVAYACGANCVTVDYPVTATDTCCTNPPALMFYPPSGSCFYPGTTNTVTCTATSACGYCNSTSFTVTVLPGPGSLGIKYQSQGKNVIITWSQGILQSSTTAYSLAGNQTVLGPYSDVPGASSPYVTQAAGATTFYRLRCPCLTCSNCLVITCPTNAITVTTCADCTNVPFGGFVGVEDNCCTNWNPPTFNYPTNFCFLANTTNTIEARVVDACGNTASNSFQLIVLPCGSPMTNCLSLTCPGTLYAGACSNTSATVDAAATLSGCTNDVSLLYTAVPPGVYSDNLSDIPFPVGTNEVTVYALQGGTNTLAECSFFVIVTNQNCTGLGAVAQWTFEVSQPEATLGAGVTLSNIVAELGEGSASAYHQRATTYSSPVGNGANHCLSANDWSVGDYFQFACPTINAGGISVAWEQISSATGPGVFQLQYSADGLNFYNFGPTYDVAANGSLSGPTSHWGSESNNPTTHYEQDLSSIPGLANAGEVWFRLVDVSSNSPGGGAAGPYGTSRVGNFTVYGGSLAGTEGIPEFTWAEPEPITYGTPLNENQLNAMASVAGNFTYLQPAGTILTTGSNLLSALFTPYPGYGPTGNISQVELVLPRTLTLSADNATWVAGEPNPEFTGTILGALNSDNVSVTWTSAATPSSPPGEYSITPGIITATGGALSNYTIIVIPGTGTTTSNDCDCVYSNLLWWTFEVSQPSGSEAAGVPITGIYPEYGSGVALGFHQGAAIYSHPSGNGSTNSFSSTNWAVGDYYQFACSNISLCGNLSATWDQASSATGPGTFQMLYSLDGADFIPFGQPYHVDVNGQLQGPSPYWNNTTRNYTTHYIQNLNAISEEPGLVSTIWVRLVDTNQIMIGTNWTTVGWNPSADGNQVGPSGSSRVDNFMLNGTRY